MKIDQNAHKQSAAKIIPFIHDGEYYFKKGLSFYRRRDMNKALKWLKRAVQMDENEPVFLCQLAAVYAECGDYDKSNKLLDKVVSEVEPEMAECYYFMANNYAHLGLFQEARRNAESYMEKAPDGEFLEDTEDLLEVLKLEVDALDEIMFLDDEEEQLILMQEQARDLMEKGAFKEAIGTLLEIIEAYPEYWSAYNNLALAHFYLEEPLKAVKVTTDLLERNPGNLHGLCNLAVFYYFLGQDEELLKIKDQLFKIFPIDIEQRYKLGATLALLGSYENAYNWLKKLLKRGMGEDASFYYWFAVSAYYMGKDELARSAWKKVIELDPEKEHCPPWKTI